MMNQKIIKKISYIIIILAFAVGFLFLTFVFAQELNKAFQKSKSIPDLNNNTNKPEPIPNNSNYGGLFERPEFNFDGFPGWEEIFGVGDAKKKLEEVMDRFQSKSDYKYNAIMAQPNKPMQYPKGVIFHGPPGTGKTFLAKAFAKKSQMSFFLITPADTLEKIQETFEKARKNSPSVIFCDEAEEVLKSRTSGQLEGGDSKKTDLFLTELDGAKTDPERPVYFIAATNHLDKIDSAIISRLENIYFGYLDNSERLEYLKAAILKYKPIKNKDGEKYFYLNPRIDLYLQHINDKINQASQIPEKYFQRIQKGYLIPALGKSEEKGKLELNDMNSSTPAISKELEKEIELENRIKQHLNDFLSNRKLDMFIQKAAEKAGFYNHERILMSDLEESLQESIGPNEYLYDFNKEKFLQMGVYLKCFYPEIFQTNDWQNEDSKCPEEKIKTPKDLYNDIKKTLVLEPEKDKDIIKNYYNKLKKEQEEQKKTKQIDTFENENYNDLLPSCPQQTLTNNEIKKIQNRIWYELENTLLQKYEQIQNPSDKEQLAKIFLEFYENSGFNPKIIDRKNIYRLLNEIYPVVLKQENMNQTIMKNLDNVLLAIKNKHNTLNQKLTQKLKNEKNYSESEITQFINALELDFNKILDQNFQCNSLSDLLTKIDEEDIKNKKDQFILDFSGDILETLTNIMSIQSDNNDVILKVLNCFQDHYLKITDFYLKYFIQPTQEPKDYFQQEKQKLIDPFITIFQKFIDENNQKEQNNDALKEKIKQLQLEMQNLQTARYNLINNLQSTETVLPILQPSQDLNIKSYISNYNDSIDLNTNQTQKINTQINNIITSLKNMQNSNNNNYDDFESFIIDIFDSIHSFQKTLKSQNDSFDSWKKEKKQTITQKIETQLNPPLTKDINSIQKVLQLIQSLLAGLQEFESLNKSLNMPYNIFDDFYKIEKKLKDLFTLLTKYRDQKTYLDPINKYISQQLNPDNIDIIQEIKFFLSQLKYPRQLNCTINKCSQNSFQHILKCIVEPKIQKYNESKNENIKNIQNSITNSLNLILPLLNKYLDKYLEHFNKNIDKLQEYCFKVSDEWVTEYKIESSSKLFKDQYENLKKLYLKYKNIIQKEQQPSQQNLLPDPPLENSKSLTKKDIQSSQEIIKKFIDNCNMHTPTTSFDWNL